jgi:23S rRNA pseudouridine955/2504/2580 synthase
MMGKKTFIVKDDQVKIEKFLKGLGISYMAASQLMRKGNIKVNGIRERKSSTLKGGDIVEIFGFEEPQDEKTVVFTKRHKEIAEQLVRDIIYKDENILVINKPAGIAVQGGNKVKISIDDLSHFLRFDLESKPKLVHRLDRDTSGILVMARNDSAAKTLSHMFKESGTIKKNYLALCHGVPYKLQGTISIPLAKVKFDKEIVSYVTSGSEAITHYKVVKHNDKFSLIQFNIVTGRTHQVRAHCAISGLPIVGDGKYNTSYFEMVKSHLSLEEKKRFILNNKVITQYKYDKLCLHSEAIDLTLFHKRIAVSVEPPKDFQLLIEKIFF